MHTGPQVVELMDVWLNWMNVLLPLNPWVFVYTLGFVFKTGKIVKRNVSRYVCPRVVPAYVLCLELCDFVVIFMVNGSCKTYRKSSFLCLSLSS